MIPGDIFINEGTLGMSTTPSEAAATLTAWGDMLPNRILVAITLLLLLINLLDFMRIWPSLIFCLQKAFGNSDLEHSLSQARMRNNSAAVLFLAFCLVADRFALYRPDWWSVIPAQWSACATIGVMILFLILRALTSIPVSSRKIGSEAFHTARHTPWNIFIIFAITMLVTVGLLMLVGASDGFTAGTILVEAALFYLLVLIRTGQILGEHCNGFSTILYLCALEILPAAILVASAVLF